VASLLILIPCCWPAFLSPQLAVRLFPPQSRRASLAGHAQRIGATTIRVSFFECALRTPRSCLVCTPLRTPQLGLGLRSFRDRWFPELFCSQSLSLFVAPVPPSFRFEGRTKLYSRQTPPRWSALSCPLTGFCGSQKMIFFGVPTLCCCDCELFLLLTTSGGIEPPSTADGPGPASFVVFIVLTPGLILNRFSFKMDLPCVSQALPGTTSLSLVFPEPNPTVGSFPALGTVCVSIFLHFPIFPSSVATFFLLASERDLSFT